jgi:hypothetical protein
MIRKIKVISLAFIIGFALICLYKFIITWNILEFKVDNIDVIKADECTNFYNELPYMNKRQKIAVKENPKDYRLLDYNITPRNKSNKLYISGMFVFPAFYGDLEKIIFWYDLFGGIDSGLKPLLINPKTESSFRKSIIVKRNGLSDAQIRKTAKNVKFKIIYIASEESWINFDNPEIDDKMHSYWKIICKFFTTNFINYAEFDYKEKG